MDVSDIVVDVDMLNYLRFWKFRKLSKAGNSPEKLGGKWQKQHDAAGNLLIYGKDMSLQKTYCKDKKIH